MRCALLLCALAIICGCVRPARGPEEVLDQSTGAMVGHARSATTFARERPDIAVNSRQYVTVTGVSVNRSGHYEFLLLAYSWSTIDQRLAPAAPSGNVLFILADGRVIRLHRDLRSLRDAGVGAAYGKPLHARDAPRIYPIDGATLRFIARSRSVKIGFEGDTDERPYALWQDARARLEELAAVASRGLDHEDTR